MPVGFRVPGASRMILVLLVGLTMPALRHAVAQAPAPSATIGFEREVNRYRWSSTVGVDEAVGTWRLQAINRFASDAFTLFDNRLSFRDEDHLRWTMSGPPGRKVGTGVRGETVWISQGRVLQQTLVGFLPITPAPWVFLEPAAGLALDQRPGALDETGQAPLRRDAGPHVGGRLTLSPAEIDGYRLRLDTDANLQVITPRRGGQLRVDGALEKFFDETRFATRLGYDRVRRDAYQAISFLNRDAGAFSPETVEATTSDTLMAGIDLAATLVKGFSFIGRLDLGANNRLVRSYRTPADALSFDTNFRRRAIDLEAGFRFDTPRVQAALTLLLGAETESRTLANRDDLPPAQAAQKGALLEQADYEQSFYTLRWQSQARITQRLSSILEGAATLLRHDTPEINLDDRDEVRFNGQAGLQYQLTPALQADVRLLANYYHTVFLKAQRSAENSVQQALRLRPSLLWSPSPATLLQIASEVRATYTVDDYVLEGRRPQDQSARELRYDLVFEQALGAGIRLLAEGTVSDLRLGRFFQDRFAEIPFDTLRTYGGRLRVRTGGRVGAELGVRAFVRTDFDRATAVRYRRLDETGALLRDEAGASVRTTISRPGRRWIEQLGPTAGLDWRMTSGGSLRLDGWLNWQHIHYRLYGELPEDTAAHIRAEARRGTTRYIPNLAVTVSWPL